MNEIQQLTFDYSALPADVATVARLASERIKMRLRRTAEDIVEIGRELSEIKEKIGHGNFLPWVEAEFEMGSTSAQRFMQTYEKFGKSTNLVNFKPSVLYLLAAPSTTDPVIAKAVEQSQAGEKVTVADVQRWKAEAEKANASVVNLKEALREAVNRPPKVEVQEVVREVVPEDYQQAKQKAETLKAELAKNKEYLDRLKKEQAAAIEKGVKDQIEFRRKEIVQMEQNKAGLERRIKELADYHKVHNDKIATLHYHEEIRKKVYEALDSLGFDLVEFDQVDDDGNKNKWEGLAIRLDQAAQAVRAVAVHGHAPAMESWNEEATQ